MSGILAALTLGSIVLIVYHHVGYPALLAGLAQWRRLRRSRPVPPPPGWTPPLPGVVILVPAFNEAGVIADKICNTASLDYPSELLRLVIVCDGCSDDTAARARAAAAAIECRHLRVEVREYPDNRGKLARLNEAIPALDADIIAPSDASALISIDALRIAAGHFADPQVGVVCATYRLIRPGSTGEAVYWRHQVRVKELEAGLGAPLGAHGALYLLRRRLFAPLSHIINDDFVIPMRIVAAGHRAVYEPQMIAVELQPSPLRQDFRRRRRIAAGNLQQVIELRRLLHPGHGGIALTFASGKVLRTLVPFLMVLSLAGSVALAGSSRLFALLALAQGLVYALVLARQLTPGIPWPRIADVIHYLVGGHLIGLTAGTGYLLGLQRTQWSAADAATSTPPSPGRQAGHVPANYDVVPWRDDAPSHVDPAVALAKRMVDLVGASIGLLFTLPLCLLVAVLIRLDSPGPIFLRQLRIGESLPDRTRLFQILKFRTMRVDAEEATGAVWATRNDPRITRVGRWLRKSRIDELPQLVNVLRGEMSLIGPRPERPGIASWLDGKIPFYVERTFGVKPGISGYAQVSSGYDTSIDDVRTKLYFDHAYALALNKLRTWLALDLRIAARTLGVMLSQAGH